VVINDKFYHDKITKSTSLVDVFYSIIRGNCANGRNLAHTTHMISSIFGNMTMYQGLRNTRIDGFRALARQSKSAILNAFCRPLNYAFIPIKLCIMFQNSLVNKQSTFWMAREFEFADTAPGSKHSNSNGDYDIHKQASKL
jgi:hypothetical protein